MGVEVRRALVLTSKTVAAPLTDFHPTENLQDAPMLSRPCGKVPGCSQRCPADTPAASAPTSGIGWLQGIHCACPRSVNARCT